MSIVALRPSTAKSKRPFAEGLTESVVTMLGVEMTASWRDDINTVLAGGPTRLDRDIRRGLSSVGYTAVACSAALAWVQHRNTLTGCPVIEAEDVEAVNAIIARHRRPEKPAPAAEPVPTEVVSARYRQFGPTLADEVWHVAESSAAENREADRAAWIAKAEELNSAGLECSAWSDADQLQHAAL